MHLLKTMETILTKSIAYNNVIAHHTSMRELHRQKISETLTFNKIPTSLKLSQMSCRSHLCYKMNSKSLLTRIAMLDQPETKHQLGAELPKFTSLSKWKLKSFRRRKRSKGSRELVKVHLQDALFRDLAANQQVRDPMWALISSDGPTATPANLFNGIQRMECWNKRRSSSRKAPNFKSTPSHAVETVLERVTPTIVRSIAQEPSFWQPSLPTKSIHKDKHQDQEVCHANNEQRNRLNQLKKEWSDSFCKNFKTQAQNKTVGIRQM